MEEIIKRLEKLHRALRTAPAQVERDVQAAISVAICLRDLHAIAAQARAGGNERPSLRLIDCGLADQSRASPPVSRKLSRRSSAAHDHVAETPS
ncbi:hypothetical protein SAMN06265338_106220 [Rhodoblastus acidophilus]|uniref:Uncharacterized protein n=1 Tax=Rhodoblastus acidophilus TaxID=1074 RepID=A0A212RS87_RHOAC|nr:hypothetical protein [Rhodoblastus acidophilus]RAI16434.1 hypothetical protein CH337_21425 [Rhodoblastus acidophilus]SNB75364.1 hypothetical protein SAMN06265338_106220 [Rhodoblastus acidophilus]